MRDLLWTRVVRLAAVMAAILLLWNQPTGAVSVQAANITSRCSFAPSSNGRAFRLALDDNYGTRWVVAQGGAASVTITVPAGGRVGGVYVLWSSTPARWQLKAVNGRESAVVAEGADGELTKFIAVSPQYAACGKLRLEITARASCETGLADIAVYSPGALPSYVPRWQQPSRVDLLTIAAHPDDEALYLSVPAVTYANQGRKCQTVFMTFANVASQRRYEAQESCWSLGNRYCPELGPFQDVKRTSLGDMMRVWPKDQVVGYLVEMIRKYQPSVIVTHDPNGEYGHGAHKLTEYAAELAFRDAADPGKYPQSRAKYGVWKAGKLYAHLYRANKLNPMGLTAPMGAFGNRTVLQVIKAAYARHRSQLPGRSLPTDGPYDMKAFGLVATNLGADIRRQSMFENVSPSAMARLNPSFGYTMTDRKDLGAAIQRARSLVECNYTAESWRAADLPSIIAAADKVMLNGASSQSEIDSMCKKLNDAMALLVRVSDPTCPPAPRF